MREGGEFGAQGENPPRQVCRTQQRGDWRHGCVMACEGSEWR